MEKKYKGIIFDLDGVICHTDMYHYKAWKAIAEKLQIPFDEKKNNLLRGISRAESLDIILSGSSLKLTEREKNSLTEEKNNIYRDMLSKMSESDIDTETKNMLITLKKKYMLAVASSSKNALYILQKLKIDILFNVIVQGSDINYSKPHPEVFMLASEKMKLKSKECLVVEDSKSGVIAALAGGVDCAGLGDASKLNCTTYPIKNLKNIEAILL